MPVLTIKIPDDLWKKLQSRAKKSFLAPEDLITDIVRRSMLTYTGKPSETDKVDDPLISIFSRKASTKKSKKYQNDPNNPAPSPEGY
jgi:hypothetical protein